MTVQYLTAQAKLLCQFRPGEVLGDKSSFPETTHYLLVTPPRSTLVPEPEWRRKLNIISLERTIEYTSGLYNPISPFVYYLYIFHSTE